MSTDTSPLQPSKGLQCGKGAQEGHINTETFPSLIISGDSDEEINPIQLHEY